ncbi:MAG: hypothetical protein O7G84_00995 [Gammaproteobacteria bacterium]|nr:hypothetical protein [Gammaproteobacteria bacterium]
MPKLEAAADKVIALCNELGLTVDEVATMTHTIAVNHFVASGVTEQRAARATQLAHRWRVSQGQNDRVLVKRPPRIEGT